MATHKSSEKVQKQKRDEAKALTQHKHARRQWVTFWRMCRYGINNFTRNAWLTLAATAIMTITLLTIFAGVVSQKVFTDTVEQLRDEVKMSIYLSTGTEADEAEAVRQELESLESVISVGIESPEDARENFIEQSVDSPESLEAVKEATNQFPWTLSIKVENINDTSELSKFVDENETLAAVIDKNRDPSFEGDRRSAIETIGNAADFAQRASIIAIAVFVVISMLIIFNTIRMAIFNRREEIQMMKLIGAESSFIRGPFLVEAIVYGFFAALIASGIGYALVIFGEPTLTSAGISMSGTVTMLTLYAGFVLLGMILIGAFIGVVSSLLATRRYLKI